MLIDNHYEHCGESWTVEDCDCFHDDRCPICNKEVSPVESTEYTDEGDKQHYHY